MCVVTIIITMFDIFFNGEQSAAEENQIITLTLWQVDSFEGGTGSRAAYLQEKGNEYKKLGNEYINVVSLSAEAARLNIINGNVPDMISFGGGEWGLESIINCNYQIKYWCYGSYCLLAVGDNVDFSKATAENTIINGGKGNLISATALLCGLDGADIQSSTYAYVDLINGKYDFLLGTQRDIYRLNARKVSYSVKAIGQFNDLFQLIAVCSEDAQRATSCYEFIEYVSDNNSDVYKLGLLGGKIGTNEKIMPIEKIDYELTLKVPISESIRKELEQVIELKDINKLKTLLK